MPHLDGTDPESAEQAKTQAVQYGTEPLLSLQSPVTKDDLPYFAQDWKNRPAEATVWSGFVYEIPWRDSAKVRAALALLPDTKPQPIAPPKR